MRGFLNRYSHPISSYEFSSPGPRRTQTNQKYLTIIAGQRNQEELQSAENVRSCIAVYIEIKEPVFFVILFNCIIYHGSGKFSYASLSDVCSPRLRKCILCGHSTAGEMCRHSIDHEFYKETNCFYIGQCIKWLFVFMWSNRYICSYM